MSFAPAAGVSLLIGAVPASHFLVIGITRKYGNAANPASETFRCLAAVANDQKNTLASVLSGHTTERSCAGLEPQFTHPALRCVNSTAFRCCCLDGRTPHSRAGISFYWGAIPHGLCPLYAHTLVSAVSSGHREPVLLHGGQSARPFHPPKADKRCTVPVRKPDSASKKIRLRRMLRVEYPVGLPVCLCVHADRSACTHRQTLGIEHVTCFISPAFLYQGRTLIELEFGHTLCL
jgi:hypothetical protein